MHIDKHHRRRKCLVATCLGLAFGLGLLTTVQLATAQTPTTTVTVTAQEAPPSPEELQSDVENLEARTDDLDRFINRLLLPLSILVGLLAGGGVIGLLTSIRYERRQSQIHDLAISGETASQGRAEQSHMTFLASSQETLNLVNDTLSLAKQASERAAEAMEQKAKDSLLELDGQIKELLEQAYVTRDFKEVVSNSTIRYGLIDLAHQLGAIEGYIHLQGMSLTPRCLFVKGFDRHLKSAPTAAIANLSAAQTAEDPDLSALALFWAGYEANNIGSFARAMDFFRRAQGQVDQTSPKFFDLRRIQIQTRFFERIANHPPPIGADRRAFVADLEGEFRSLSISIQDKGDDFEVERGLCHQSVADVLLWAGRISPIEREVDEQLSVGERACLEEALHHYEESGDHLWPRFGALQARWALGHEVTETEYEDIHAQLVTQAHAHREQRTLALRQASILIVEQSHSEPDSVLSRTHRDLRDVMGHIDDHLTLFSPWQKRNVEHGVFEDEVREYHRRASLASSGSTESR